MRKSTWSRGIVALAALHMVGLSVISAGCSAGDDRATYRDENAGLEFRYPSRWHAQRGNALLPVQNDPRPLVSFATFAMKRTSAKCSIFPVDHLRAIGRRGVLVIVYERYSSINVLLPRPTKLGPSNARTNDTSTLCPGAPSHHFFVDFQDSGRGIQVYLGFGPSAAKRDIAEAWRVANSLSLR